MGSVSPPVDYWEQYCSGLESNLLPWRGNNRKTDKQINAFAIDIPFHQQLLGFAQDHSTTVELVLRAAWAVLLGRYTSSDEVCFVEHLISPEVSSCGLSRITLSDKTSILDVVDRMEGQSQLHRQHFFPDYCQLVSGLPRDPKDVCSASFVELMAASPEKMKIPDEVSNCNGTLRLMY